MVIDVFIPCFIDQFYPKTAQDFVHIMQMAGCSVRYNPEQTCCGQPAYNSGYWNEARTIAEKFLTDFHSAQCIVTPSASCAGFVKNHYQKLFEESGDKWTQDAKHIKQKIFEFSDYLVNSLKIEELGAVFPHKVTFHDSCAGLREYGIKTEPRKLLKGVKGLELIEMHDLETCCGFGGTFAAKFHHISAAMTEQKVENALKTGAEYIVSTEASCLMNMQGYITKNNLPIKTIHLASVLASGL